MPSQKWSPHPYPYKLKAPAVDDTDLTKVDQRNALEFLRIEALLRSPEVQKLYIEGDGESLARQYSITSRDFLGLHHYLLHPQALEDQGIADIDEWSAVPELSALHLRNPIRHNDPERYLHLQFDCAVPPNRILKSLKPLLVAHHLQVQRTNNTHRPLYSSLTVLDHPKERPPILKLRPWLTYLKCYDLRQNNGLSFGQIAQKVFGAIPKRTEKGTRQRQAQYDKAERGYKAVEYIIKCAVSKKGWPPKTFWDT